MPRSTISRAAAAVVALTSTVSAVYAPGGSNNVVMYWGQGNDQYPLSVACADPAIDVVTLGFVNGFPSKEGEYPATNFANACWGTYYPDPFDSEKKSGLLKDCPSINEGIAVCRKNNKKVLLSLGGGLPTNYYLPDEKTTTWFAKFLVGAFGPKQDSWTGPRPIGDEFVDGFDLDLEAEASKVPRPEFISANYGFLVNELKRFNNDFIITAAPQCEVPDIRLFDAIKNAHFDMIFTQFYNTPKCSARQGFKELTPKKGDPPSTFTFENWAVWLSENSKNKAVKLYLGLPASPKGSPSYQDHYLKPNEANDLVAKWRFAQKTSPFFGGIMLWEHKVSADNVIDCKNYGAWMKDILSSKFGSTWTKGCVKTSSSATVASSTRLSSTRASSTRLSSTRASSTPASSTLASSTRVSSSSASSTPASSSIASSIPSSSSIASSTSASSSIASSIPSSSSIASSTSASSSVASSISASSSIASSTAASSTAASSTESSSSIASSTPASSAQGSSTIASSSTVSTTSAAVSPTATMPTVDGHCGDQGHGIVYTCHGYNNGNCCSQYGYCGGLGDAGAAYCGEGCNPLFGECDNTSQSSSVASSTSVASSSVASSSTVESSSATESSSTVEASSTVASSSSVASSSAIASSSVASSSIVSSTATSASSSASVSSSSYSETTPVATSSASQSSVIESSTLSVPYPSGNITYTPYPTGSASIVYPEDVSKSLYPHSSQTLTYSSQSGVHYPAGNATTPCTTSTAAPSSSSPAPVYGASSSAPAPVYGGQYPPSVTSMPGQNYPSYPASSTVKVITTTYVDACETGITTKTETITQTVCNKCKGDSVTSVYVCNKCGPAVVPYTITKPASPATDVPVVPTMPVQPSSPSHGGDKPQSPAKESTPSYGGERPHNTPTYEVPKKQEVPGASTTVEIVYITKTPIPMAPTVQHTPAMPYPSAPVQNGTSGYPVKPSGTGVATPTKPSSYTPPAQFTGAASHLSAGMAGLLAVVAGLFVL
ncbi:chitinase [Parastagonospora nodorum]|nr:chitinase [Parastagonospora nodorum]